MRINTKQIIDWCGASCVIEPLDASHLATSITWDSRAVEPDALYVAFLGERVNGHDFVRAALLAGACIVLVMEPLPQEVLRLAREMGAAVLEVADTHSAVVDLAAQWRKRLHAHVIALTGSTGKTTTKNLIRDVLSTTFNTTATKANQNNELGVPNTILSANPETEFVVVEMGMRGLHQIEALCSYVLPEAALITNVGTSHMELLGSQENIARAKGEIIAALPQTTGKAFLNAHDEWSAFIVKEAEAVERTIQLAYYDGSGEADPLSVVWATDIELDGEGCPHFILHVGDEQAPCVLSLRGVHNVENACGAALVGQAYGLDLATIIAGLESSLPEVGRQEIVQGKNDVMIVNDAYNANPDSMRASLALFAAMDVPHKRYAVLGDMGELGDSAVACHEGIGRFVATLPLDRLICVGELAKSIASAAIAAGYPSEKVYTTENRGEALHDLETHLEPGDAVLVKASHFMEFERIVRGLTL